MFVETITWEHLPQLCGKQVILFGTDKPALDLLQHIKDKGYDITINAVVDIQVKCSGFAGYPLHSVQDMLSANALDGKVLLIASVNPMLALNACIDASPAEIWLCSRAFHALFEPEHQLRQFQAQKSCTPFFLRRDTSPVPALVTNAILEPGACKDGPAYEDVIEVADFAKQEYTSWRVPQTLFPLDLKEFSGAIRPDTLPMRMTHIGYLMWKRAIHVAQMSPSRRYIVGARYNFFHLDILDTVTGQWIQWHDLPPEQGLWDYVATGDFDYEEECFYFVRWPLADAIRGMSDGTNRVHCQVGKLHLDTLKAEILQEFDFQDRIHQCSISGDGRYMVFAPMRVLRPEGDPRKIKQEDLMRNLQKTVKLDSMATLDLHTGKVWYTEIPYPIPAHFELDPFDPHVFYVSTHSLMPHADGVLCFQPGTVHKMRIKDGETVIENTYTHPGFVRTTQHCVFAYKGKTLIAATNQNKIEIIDGETMTLWHCHKMFDDPFYDNADFNDPQFLSKPFNLPAFPDHCDSVSASGDGRYLILRLPRSYKLFDLETRQECGEVLFRSGRRTPSHSRYYMQNAPLHILEQRYAALASSR